MPDIDLPYGNGSVRMRYDNALAEVLAPAASDTHLDSDAVRAALCTPTDSPTLAELARRASSALIVVSDVTRVSRADLLLPLALEELTAGGIHRDAVTVIVALGNHRKATPEEVDRILGAELARSLDVRQHDSRDSASLRSVGVTSRGVEAALNRLLWERDIVITISSVTAHYFAGFGGGRKNIFPGLGNRQGIIANHQLSIDFEAGRLADGVETGRMDGNPVHEDFVEIAAKRPPDICINAVLTGSWEIGSLHCGHWLESHRAACAEYMRRHGVRIQKRRPLVIAGCGGAPKDINLIQSHKTIQYASRALEPGGTLLLLAECPDGMGNASFASYFPIKNVRELLTRIREENPPNGQTALALHQKTREYRIGLISSLPESTVSDMGMTPLHNLNDALVWAKAEKSQTFIIPHGAETIPLFEN